MKGCKALRHRFPFCGFESFFNSLSFFSLSLFLSHYSLCCRSGLSFVSFFLFLSLSFSFSFCSSESVFSLQLAMELGKYKMKNGGFLLGLGEL